MFAANKPASHAALTLISLTLLLIATRAEWQPATAQPAAPPPSQSLAQPAAPVELFKGPHYRFVPVPDCDMQGRLALDSEICRTLRDGIEGWAQLNFMVDPTGKPLEVTVIRSTGNQMFDQIAIKSIEASSFVPGSLNGTPIEAGYAMKFKFVSGRFAQRGGARREFIVAYDDLRKAIDAGDRKAADVAMDKLNVTNLYEDAYLGMAHYFYALKWGDQNEQLDGLLRAIAEEDKALYLPSDLFRSALRVSMELQVKLALYAEALDTYRKLQKLGIDRATAARFEPVVAQLQKIRSDDSSYAVSGAMPEGSWNLHLFKRHFQTEIESGSITEVKLRCEKNYVFFKFDPNLQYQVASKDGDCQMELVGAPGTKFKLFQF